MPSATATESLGTFAAPDRKASGVGATSLRLRLRVGCERGAELGAVDRREDDGAVDADDERVSRMTAGRRGTRGALRATRAIAAT